MKPIMFSVRIHADLHVHRLRHPIRQSARDEQRHFGFLSMMRTDQDQVSRPVAGP